MTEHQSDVCNDVAPCIESVNRNSESRSLHTWCMSCAGKSVVLRHLAYQMQQLGRPVLMCAASGVAADLLSPAARTVHSAFGIKTSGSGMLHPWGPRQSSKVTAVNRAQIILVDEAFMVRWKEVCIL